MRKSRYIAIDLGAESGRVVSGKLENGILSLEEILRFPNGPVTAHGTLYWDILHLYNNILKGIREHANRFGDTVDGIGIDTWGLDFGLIDKNGALLKNPVCYRDKRTKGILEEIQHKMSLETIFKHTGLQVQPFYTLGQLYSMQINDRSILKLADKFLMMPDLLAYFLTGRTYCERTNTISTQFYDPRKGCWSKEIFDVFNLPLSIMPEIINPGTIIGELTESIKNDVGLKQAPVIAPCTHDTASAVAAVPNGDNDSAFMNSGTWSVLGALTEDVITSDAAFNAAIVNEATIDSFFLCRNIMGLWLLQQARAVWHQNGEKYSYEQLVELAKQTDSHVPTINPNDLRFLMPDNMCQPIQDFCQKTNQTVPQGPAQITRCILKSLALSYRDGLEKLAHVLSRDFKSVVIVGGGSLNTLLCQFTSNAADIPVFAGPAEATVAGNVLVQAIACGELRSSKEIRKVIQNSASIKEYYPQEKEKWEEYYAEYLDILRMSEK